MKKVIMFCAFVLLIYTTTALGFTTNEFVVNIDGGGSLFIDSFPEEMNDIPEPNYPHYLTCLCREKGVWDEHSIFAGLQNCPAEKVRPAYEKMVALMDALDKIVVDDKIICFSYILCYHDAVIYFEEDYTRKQLNLIVLKLNAARIQFLAKG